jgi:hypothetical protein
MQPRTKIEFARLNSIRQQLRAVPQKDMTPHEITKSEAIRHLLPEILELRSKGHSVQEIAQLLSDSGVPVSPWTVKNILARSEEPPVRQPSPRAQSASRTHGQRQSARESHEQGARSNRFEPAHAVSSASSGALEQSETESADRSTRRSKDAPERLRGGRLEGKTTNGPAGSAGAGEANRTGPGGEESAPAVQEGSSSNCGFVVRPDDEHL